MWSRGFSAGCCMSVESLSSTSLKRLEMALKRPYLGTVAENLSSVMRVGLCYEVNGGVFFSPRMELRRAFPAGNLKTSVWISFQPKSSCSVREEGEEEGKR